MFWCGKVLSVLPLLHTDEVTKKYRLKMWILISPCKRTETIRIATNPSGNWYGKPPFREIAPDNWGNLILPGRQRSLLQARVYSSSWQTPDPIDPYHYQRMTNVIKNEWEPKRGKCSTKLTATHQKTRSHFCLTYQIKDFNHLQSDVATSHLLHIKQ